MAASKRPYFKPGIKAFKLTPEKLEKIREDAALFLPKREMAADLGIAPSTLLSKRKEISAISEAIEDGRQRTLRQVAEALIKNATEMAVDKDGNKVGLPGGDVAAQKFILERKGGWVAPKAESADEQIDEVIFRRTTKKSNVENADD